MKAKKRLAHQSRIRYSNRMDWKQVIAKIQAGGLTQKQIADACECAQGVISYLANGKTLDPRHSLGQSLLTLLAQLDNKHG